MKRLVGFMHFTIAGRNCNYPTLQRCYPLTVLRKEAILFPSFLPSFFLSFLFWGPVYLLFSSQRKPSTITIYSIYGSSLSACLPACQPHPIYILYYYNILFSLETHSDMSDQTRQDKTRQDKTGDPSASI